MSRLPVDPERLRKQFKDLSEEDLEAYAAVTRRVLEDPARKGRLMREILLLARGARAKRAAGEALTADEQQALGYLHALEKMQGSTVA